MPARTRFDGTQPTYVEASASDEESLEVVDGDDDGHVL